MKSRIFCGVIAPTPLSAKAVSKYDSVLIVSVIISVHGYSWNVAKSVNQIFLPLEYFYPGSAGSSVGMINPIQPMWGNMGEWVLFKQYENMYAKTSSQIGGWEWVSDLGYIKLYPAPCGCNTAMVHYLQKCKDWKEINQAMVEGAVAYSMIILGNIRGKYQSPPGPGGGMAMDGEYMRTKGEEKFDKWKYAAKVLRVERKICPLFTIKHIPDNSDIVWHFIDAFSGNGVKCVVIKEFSTSIFLKYPQYVINNEV